MLFVQGSRDAFGTPEELAPVLTPLGPAATVHVVPGGDHSFKVPRRGPVAQAAVLEGIRDEIAGWVRRLP
jgi:predicted alpha/beta-hydrolase family hydrolase